MSTLSSDTMVGDFDVKMDSDDSEDEKPLLFRDQEKSTDIGSLPVDRRTVTISQRNLRPGLPTPLRLRLRL
jgi:hypothetical protein